METLLISYRAQFTRQTEILVQTFVKKTGVPKYALLVPAAGNSSYMKQSGASGTHGVSVGKHDTFLENVSALWPLDLDWPEGVPRPPREKASFTQLPQDARNTLAEQIAKKKLKLSEGKV